MSYTAYTTKEGDTWTGIAFKAYGDVTLAGNIIDVNPLYSLASVFPEGVVLLVPILEKTVVSSKNLPPWKR